MHSWIWRSIPWIWSFWAIWTPSHHRPFKLGFDFEVHLDQVFATQGWGQRSKSLLVFLDELSETWVQVHAVQFPNKMFLSMEVALPFFLFLHTPHCFRGYVVVCFLGTLLYTCSSCSSKIPNPKLTNLAGYLDGAPIHRHFKNLKTKTLSRDRSIIQHFIDTTGIRCFLSIHRVQCDCDCDSRARCAAAVRSHNATPPFEILKRSRSSG